jgi:hypothetical protein
MSSLHFWAQRLVTKDELLKQVWPIFVEEGNLAHIFVLRQMLEDSHQVQPISRRSNEDADSQVGEIQSIERSDPHRRSTPASTSSLRRRKLIRPAGI